jgi:hypothetical protein
LSNRICFESKQFGIAFNFTNNFYPNAYKTSILLRAYLELDHRAKILAFCLRYIAKVRPILCFSK